MLNENVRSMENRYEIITRWYKMGGVLLIGYEMYRLLALSVPSIGGNNVATLLNLFFYIFLLSP